MVAALFFMPGLSYEKAEAENVFEVMLDGQSVGRLRDRDSAARLLSQVRKELAGSDDLFLSDAQLYIEGRQDSLAHFTDEETMKESMRQILSEGSIKSDEPAYSVKVGSAMVSVRDLDQVRAALQKALDAYQDGQEFEVTLSADEDRHMNVLTAGTRKREEALAEENTVFPDAGVGDDIDTQKLDNITSGTGFDAFDYGLKDLYFASKVEVTEAYLSEDELCDTDTAAQTLTKLWQEEKSYEIQSGDTLSEIAINTGTPLDVLIELNDSLEDENSTIRQGQELIITSAVPTLSIGRVEDMYYEEDYEADIEYVYNDAWYTTDKEVLQAPSAGHRKVAAKKTFLNDEETGCEILLEDVTYPAVPKIVEVGTKIPPTYIKPISGGRISSPFGRRKAPKKGASTYHKGIDWATPVGTAVVASSGGVVDRAGWGSGYGYVVYISHADGRQTRYGHLSKILVKPGEKVSQGQKIALSGNTGRSTGPHIHFEMLIDGVAVDPLKYLN